jgi:pimeloyl-ACP methyl ester carboxylesterase
MPSRKAQVRSAAHTHAAAQPPTISGRWLLAAIGWTVLAAALCAWGTLSLLFWQGGWQLLYHPSANIARTPAGAGIAFNRIGFAATDTGLLQIQGWWIPAAASAPFGRYTVLYLHGPDGNLGDTVDALATLHAAGVNVMGFDYRGYGQSGFARPSEAHWREDAEWALQYLTATRHADPHTIVLDGSGLGANLALEIAAAHPELAGVVLNAPLDAPMAAILNDARARLVPARLLMRDRYGLDAPSAALRIPSLWVLPAPNQAGINNSGKQPQALQKVSAPKTQIWLPASADANKTFADALSRWLSNLPIR